MFQILDLAFFTAMHVPYTVTAGAGRDRRCNYEGRNPNWSFLEAPFGSISSASSLIGREFEHAGTRHLKILRQK